MADDTPQEATNAQGVENEPIRRGLLDLTVTLSTPDPTAGNDFSVYLLITNPFDTPIWIEHVKVSLPSEIIRLEPMQERIHRVWRRLEEVMGEVAAPPEKVSLWQRLRAWLRRQSREERERERLFNQVASELLRANREFEEAGKALAALQQERPGRDAENYEAYQAREATLWEQLRQRRERLGQLMALIAEMMGGVGIYGAGDVQLRAARLPSQVYITAQGDIQLTNLTTTSQREEQLTLSLPPGMALHPGETTVSTIVLKTKAPLFFRPIQYMMHFNVNYAFSPPQTEDTTQTRLHTNTIAQPLVIRAPVWAIMVGAVVGGLAGFGARFAQTLSSGAALPLNVGEVLVSALLTLILSAIAVVLVARKSDTQSFVTVEDFWGGVVIGFLVGYTGSSAFEALAGTMPG